MRSVLILSLIFSSAFPAQAETLFGFTEENAKKHQDLEDKFEAELNADNMTRWMKEMTTRPHNVGSPKAKENAEAIAAQFKSWGYDVEIEVFHVLFPTPKKRYLKMLRPVPFEASLQEVIMDGDSVADALRAEALPPFNAYSADGKVTAPLVYVNQGLPRDYDVLEEHGIDVRGKIAIARYGGSWRGIKPKVAAEHGAIGCIIYNDPLADGYARGAGYPNGAFKHGTAVQRGSVLDLPMRPGDPLTPGYGATERADRLNRNDAETIMPIPVLPISSVDAEPFFRALDGPPAPSSWRGALPLTYNLGGGGKTVVTLEMEFNWDLVPAYNVIAKMEGSTYPDEWVIRGNHHDAWVIGARDPISGMVTVLEEARALGELAKTGWQPKRTIVYCAWDGEEPGLLGSVEWVEHHAKELKEKAVAYINTDGNSRGFLNIGGSHAFTTLSAQTAKSVSDPQTDVTVSERQRSYRLVNGSPDQKRKATSSSDIEMYALGSGSDYSGFLQHLGIPSFNVSFGGEGVGGEYHTCFDTFDHFSKWVDPGNEYGAALSNVCGRLTLRLADADVLPFDFNKTATTIKSYADEVVKLADTQRTETESFNRLVKDNRFALANDPTKKLVTPETEEPVPHFNFAPLHNAVGNMETLSKNYNVLRTSVINGDVKLSKDQFHQLNQLLFQSEQAFIDPKGLPRRPWFRHRIYAPGFYTGYGVKTLPGIREGIEQRDYKETQEQIIFTAQAIQRFNKVISDAMDVIKAAQ